MRRLWFPLFLVLAGACAASGEDDGDLPTDAGSKKDVKTDSKGEVDADEEEDASEEELDSSAPSDSGVKDTSVKDTSVNDTSVKDTSVKDTSVKDTSTPVVDSGPPLSDASAPPGTTLLINEIDYDQPNIDSAEFVELYNPTASAINLSGYKIVFYNGALKASVDYLQIQLSGQVPAGGYFLIAAPGFKNDAGASLISFADASNNIQNGDPDGVVLFDNTNTKIDSVSYGGTMPGVTEGGTSAPTDSNTGIGSIIRSPNGTDSNVNGTDWKFTSKITPGAENILVP